MPVKIDGIKTRVKYYGVFDFRDLYRAFKEKLVDLDYLDSDKQGRNPMETYYSEKRSTDPREAKTMWLWWRMKKAPEGTTYFERHIFIDFHLRYVKDMEIMEEGQKRKVIRGEIEVLFDGHLLLDPRGEWEKHWLLKYFHEFFYNRIWRKQREQEKNNVIEEVMKIQAMVKQYFEIKHFMPLHGESFWPTYGYRQQL